MASYANSTDPHFRRVTFDTHEGHVRLEGLAEMRLQESNFPSNEAQAATGFCSTVSVNQPGHQGVEVRGLEGLSALDYCRLAEECFVLAAVGKNPEVAAELVKSGDDYLRYATSPTDGQDKQSEM